MTGRVGRRRRAFIGWGVSIVVFVASVAVGVALDNHWGWIWLAVLPPLTVSAFFTMGCAVMWAREDARVDPEP